MTKRTSLRAAARARYREKGEKENLVADSESRTTPLPGPPPQGGREQAATETEVLPERDVEAVRSSRAVDTPLTAQARALYEDSVVPVREIARLAGVSERTLYKYVQKGGWRRRYRVVARDAAMIAANCGRRMQARPGFAPAKGTDSPYIARSAGGRFIRREEAGLPHARGLKALDPAGAAIAEQACTVAAARSETAIAEAAADAQARAAEALRERQRQSRARELDTLEGVASEIVAMWQEREEGACPEADRLSALILETAFKLMGRFGARRSSAVIPEAERSEAVRNP